MKIIANKTIFYGSSGDEVKKLQKSLNQKGYSLDVDGNFGSKTQAAVKDYQKKNGLSVDGIVGNLTWGSLNKINSSKLNDSNVYQSNNIKKNNNTAVTTFQYTKAKPVYKQSEALKSAEAQLKDWENSKPSKYESRYSDKIDEILNEILHREDFKYNMSSDPLYEQYRAQYIQGGKKAMLDTMGNASALSGGYGNSYATTAGNQAYQEYLGQLNNIAIDLRDRAFDEYKYKGNNLLDNASLLRSLDGDDYEKYLDSLEKYYNDGNYFFKKLSQMSDSAFDAFSNELKMWENDRQNALDLYLDGLDRAEFKEELDFKKAEAKREQANKDRDYQLSLKKTNASSGSSKGSSGSNSKNGEKENKTNTLKYPTTYKEFVEKTGYPGVLTSSEFKQSSSYRAAYKDSYAEYLKAMYKKYAK